MHIMKNLCVNLIGFLGVYVSEDFSSRVAECTRLILVYDEFGEVKEC
jgi:hypothetical protein